MNASSKRRIGFGAAGLLAGIVLILILPSSWLFVGADRPDHTGHADGDVQYACPMFCVVMDEMPADGLCPVCGMALAPISGESRLDAAERRMAGVEATAVRRRPLIRTVRVVGEVDYDETRLSRITTRVAGWLEQVWVDTAWMEVEEGAPLAAIYSPELFSAQTEFLLARSGNDAGGGLSDAARRRLRLLGVSEEEIAELARTGEVKESLVLRAPRSGVVVERAAVEGLSVAKGALLYRIADLSRVWVQTEVFEADLPWVRVGQEVRLSVETTGADMAGRIAFVDPVIDRMTRTARVRIEVENPRGTDGARLFRIGQRVDAWIRAPIGADGRMVPPGGPVGAEPLSVPRSAVLRTGERTVLYVLFTEIEVDGRPVRDYRLNPDALPETVLYEMVGVTVGPVAHSPDAGDGEEYLPLLSAGPIGEGAVVVTRGNLLLDSQAQLSGRPSLLFPTGNRGEGGGDPHAGHR